MNLFNTLPSKNLKNEQKHQNEAQFVNRNKKLKYNICETAC